MAVFAVGFWAVEAVNSDGELTATFFMGSNAVAEADFVVNFPWFKTNLTAAEPVFEFGSVNFDKALAAEHGFYFVEELVGGLAIPAEFTVVFVLIPETKLGVGEEVSLGRFGGAGFPND